MKNENAYTIWDILISNGLTKAGAAGVIGNMEAESGLIACRLQGDFSTGYTASKAYAAKVDSGKITRDQFKHDATGGGGWGLCQWTYWSRKQGLYDYCKELGASIGDLAAQVKYFCKECRNSYAEVWKVITTTNSVQEASDAVLLKFERPANMYDKRAYRASRSKVYYDALKDRTKGEVIEPTPTAKPERVETTATCTVTLNQLKKGHKGIQVKFLQLLLINKGFSCGNSGADGDLGNGTDAALRKFQKENGLTVDGICGANTWDKLIN